MEQGLRSGSLKCCSIYNFTFACRPLTIEEVGVPTESNAIA